MGFHAAGDIFTDKSWLLSGNQTWLAMASWEIPELNGGFNGKNIKQEIFRCHVWVPEGISYFQFQLQADTQPEL